MANITRKFIVEEIAKLLDVPDSAYEAAERRYKDLGEWLHDQNKAGCASFGPHVSPQGSFRLGTVNKPWNREDFDLDLTCKLQDEFSKDIYAQRQLKELLGKDLEKYRQERAIHDKLEEKHRCWRLNYQDQLKFHMDVVPGIPEEETSRLAFREQMIRTGLEESLAGVVAELATAITDNRSPNYDKISPHWNISNPEGYAKWFESRMRQARTLLEVRASMEKVAKVDELPAYRWKTPLQMCVQILKRHRDVLFEQGPDEKPISVIITTLAARAYQGEEDIESALVRIISTMEDFVLPTTPRVANPVNPEKEDFADKWPNDPKLEANFRKWLDQLQKDFVFLGQSKDIEQLSEHISKRFGVRVDSTRMKRQQGLLEKAAAITAGVAHTDGNGIIGGTGVRNKPHKFYG